MAAAVTAGMWLERFVIIVASLSHEYNRYSWGGYQMSYIEGTIVLGSLSWFLFWFLLIIGLIPPVAIAEEKQEHLGARAIEVPQP